MSEHWNPNGGGLRDWRRAPSYRRPGQAAARRKRRRSARDIRLMIEAGLLVGLCVFSIAQMAAPQAASAVRDFTSSAVATSREWSEAGSWGGVESFVDDVPSDRTPAAPVLVTGAVRVIDGDTFDHRGQRIRISDIDTPELRGECADESRRARAAKARLRVLLAAGPFELQRSGRDEDRYGRKLRVVLRDGRSLGDQLVAEGLARTWTGQRQPWC